MTNSKTMKRALLTSVIALVVCFSMLVGTTFAWFTDSVTSSGNIIQSGTLEVAMSWAEGAKDPSATDTTWTNAEAGEIFNNTKWEPGYVEARHLKIENKGTLAFKYKLLITPNGAVEELADVIDVYFAKDAKQVDRTTFANATPVGTLRDLIDDPDGAAHGALLPKDTTATPTSYEEIGQVTSTIAFKMREEAGNEYQGKKIGSDFAIQLLATQYAFEKDSIDNGYDMDALYAVADGVYVDKNTGDYVAFDNTGLASVSKLASADDTITSVNLVTDNGTVEVPVARDNAALDNAAANNEIVVVTSGNYTVDSAKNTEVTIIGNGENTNFAVESEGEYNTDYGFDGSTVTFENLVFNVDGYLNGYARMNATYNKCIINGTYTLNGDGIFNNCTFNKTGDDYCIWTWGAPKAEFNNCTFNTDGKAILMYGGANTVLTLNNCEFNDNGGISGKAAIEVGSDWNTDTKKIVMTGCTVNGFDTTEQKSVTYGGTNLGTNVWGNKNLLPENRLTVIINGQTVYGN